MNLKLVGDLHDKFCIPRVSGGEPKHSEFPNMLKVYSPRERG